MQYDVPGKDCGEGNVGVHNGSRKIDRNNDLVDGEGTTNIALSVRTSSSPGLPPASGGISSPLTTLKGDTTTDYGRYSGDFSDALSHLQQTPQQKPSPASNNGYVPYVNYARDYSPPTQHLMQFKASSSSNSIESGGTALGKQVTSRTGNGQLPSGTMTLTRKRPTGPELPRSADNGLPNIQSSVSSIPNGLLNHPIIGCHIGLDSRFGANYGTLHGRGNSSPMGPLPLQLPLPPPATANPAATPAPPPYNAARAHACLLGLGLQPSTGGVSCTANSNLPATMVTSSSSPSSTQSGSLSLASSQLSQGQPVATGTATLGGKQEQQPQQQPSSPSGQFILPSSGTVKPGGGLATHV
ncbi:AGAP000217-PA-like protein [Anopheles sinensis]|uniref:AGAP000217-PA-like protein n=1 Tax=Anopheles sinensis TaxID=74873 RepID=A0A084VGY0_ANOSI|nr:AGAP000217-PA-like protein [Anopheles sinensis]